MLACMGPNTWHDIGMTKQILTAWSGYSHWRCRSCNTGVWGEGQDHRVICIGIKIGQSCLGLWCRNPQWLASVLNEPLSEIWSLGTCQRRKGNVGAPCELAREVNTEACWCYINTRWSYREKEQYKKLSHVHLVVITALYLTIYLCCICSICQLVVFPWSVTVVRLILTSCICACFTLFGSSVVFVMKSSLVFFFLFFVSPILFLCCSRHWIHFV